ncbi:hypothetical protein BDW71DRAFT_183662 [Aspergillus fruticulosus]
MTCRMSELLSANSGSTVIVLRKLLRTKARLPYTKYRSLNNHIRNEHEPWSEPGICALVRTVKSIRRPQMGPSRRQST